MSLEVLPYAISHAHISFHTFISFALPWLLCLATTLRSPGFNATAVIIPQC